MIKCPNCGNFCDDRVIYCNICGSAFQNNNAQPQGYSVNSYQPVGHINSQKKNDFAKASFVLGLVSIPALVTVIVPVVTGILAIVFAALSWSKIKKTNGSRTERHYTLAGFITGIVGLLISIAEICFAVQLFMNTANDFIDGLRRAG